MTRRFLHGIALFFCVATATSAADLQPKTSAAMFEGLRKGGLVIERLHTTSRGKSIDVPDGMVHHWLGTVFIPGATVGAAVRLLQDYDGHAAIYAPTIERSKLLSREGDRFRVFLRFRAKKIITVIVNTENVAEFTRLGRDRASSRIYGTRIAEVEGPGTPLEREKPVGHDGGYLWRLNTYWRFLERDGGTYVQCESLSLTRGIPSGFGWLVGPFVTSVPKDSLVFTLETTRQALAAKATKTD